MHLMKNVVDTYRTNDVITDAIQCLKVDLYQYITFQGSAVLATLLQRRVAQLDENGLLAASVRDKVNDADRKKKIYENKIREYRDRLLDLQDQVQLLRFHSRGLPIDCSSELIPQLLGRDPHDQFRIGKLWEVDV